MTLSNLNKYQIVLCSNSPRRKQLLQELNLNFICRVIPDIDESYDKCLSGNEIAEMISIKKADAYRKTMTDAELVITADTIVYVDGNVLGKPKDKSEAIKMLKFLNGKTHEVITGVCIQTLKKQKVFSVKTKVKFADLSDEEIDFYVSTYKPYDKAGAYGIQEWIGYIGIESIEGSFYNVMGLPVQKLYNALKAF